MARRVSGGTQSGGCVPRRWSDDEDRSLPGQVFNAEAPSTATSRNVARYMGLGGILAIAWAYLKGPERHRGRHFVAVDCDRVVVGIGEEVRVFPLSECVRVDRDPSGSSDSAMLTLVLVHGRRVELPDPLYPDARGMFPSKRHADLLSEIESCLRACIGTRGQDPDPNWAGGPGA